MKLVQVINKANDLVFIIENGKQVNDFRLTDVTIRVIKHQNIQSRVNSCIGS